MILFSKSTNGFYNTRVNKIIPEDAVEITEEEHKRLLEVQAVGGRITSDANNRPVIDETPRERVITCTAYQFYRALSIIGLRQAVESALVSSQNQELIDAFVKAPEFTQNHPKVLKMAQALGKTDQQIKELFELAITIEL